MGYTLEDIMEIRERPKPDIEVVLEHYRNTDDSRYHPSGLYNPYSEVGEALRGHLWHTADRYRAEYKPDGLVDVAMEEALEEVDQEVDEEEIRLYFERELTHMWDTLLRRNANNTVASIRR